jgi:subtilisin family serine protease
MGGTRAVNTDGSMHCTRFDDYGTSMAAPHVAGAWAVYKQKYPTASVATALAAFQQTGVSILDPRNNITKPRINLSNALSLTPQDLINCGSKCSITLNLGDQITLTAIPTGNHVFGVWSDACSGKTNTCTLQVIGDTTLTATFDTLQVSRAKKIIPILMMLLDD